MHPPPQDEDDRRALEIDARARISWGHEPEAVARFLRERGFPPEQVRRILDSALQERAELFKRKGIRDLALAGVVASIGLFPMGAIALEQGFNEGLKGLRPPCLLMVLAGLFLAARGTNFIVMGGKGEGPISAPDPVFDKIAQVLLALVGLVVIVFLGLLAASLLN